MSQAVWTPPLQIPFQVDGTALAYLKRQALVVWDTGTGKSGLALGAACLALQDGIDLILLICQRNKLQEWLTDDIPKFTRGVSAALYHGPKRDRLLAGRLPDVLITTYETARLDAAVPKGPRSFTDGVLLRALYGRRVMVIYDEISELGRRSSMKYKVHQYMLGRLRQRDDRMPVLGLTATPMETSYDNIFSILRLVSPKKMPLVKEFERQIVAYRDPTRYYSPVYRPEGIRWFAQACAPLILRKRKTDPDVVSQFPPFSEKIVICQMHSDQRELYKKLEDLAWGENREFIRVPGLAQALYQLAGDPLALKYAAEHGTSALARIVWEELGTELEKCSSIKAEELVRQLEFICGNGYKAVVFTFYGDSVLPALADRLAAFRVFRYSGSMGDAARERSKAEFRSIPGPAVLLSSDAGSTGINLPEATYLIEAEVGRTPKIRTQRAGRGHRIGTATPVTMLTLVAEQTVEDANAVPTLLDRNTMQDLILGDTASNGYVTAEDRREMFSRARRRR